MKIFKINRLHCNLNIILQKNKDYEYFVSNSFCIFFYINASILFVFFLDGINLAVYIHVSVSHFSDFCFQFFFPPKQNLICYHVSVSHNLLDEKHET